MGEDNLLFLLILNVGFGFSVLILLLEVKMNSIVVGGGVGLVFGFVGVFWIMFKNKLDVMDMNGDCYFDIVMLNSI